MGTHIEREWNNEIIDTDIDIGPDGTKHDDLIVALKREADRLCGKGWAQQPAQPEYEVGHVLDMDKAVDFIVGRSMDLDCRDDDGNIVVHVDTLNECVRYVGSWCYNPDEFWIEIDPLLSFQGVCDGVSFVPKGQRWELFRDGYLVDPAPYSTLQEYDEAVVQAVRTCLAEWDDANYAYLDIKESREQ